MIPLLGFDSDEAIPPDAVKANGGSWVARYCGNISAAEYQSYRDAGLSVMMLFEIGYGDYLSNPKQAYAMGVFARGQAQDAGFPASRPIFASIDIDIPPQDFQRATNYVLNFAHGTGGQSGGYGSNPLGRFAMSNGVEFWYMSGGWDDDDPCKAQALQCHRTYNAPLEGFSTILPGTSVTVDYAWAQVLDFGQAPIPVQPPPPTKEMDMQVVYAEGPAVGEISENSYWLVGADGGGSWGEHLTGPAPPAEGVVTTWEIICGPHKKMTTAQLASLNLTVV